MIVIIRGHIRDSFKTPQLREFIQNLYARYPNLSIYIHTYMECICKYVKLAKNKCG
jgi:hypothetical protein